MASDQISQTCRCGLPVTHALDEARYCCACFDVAVAHGANLRASGVMFSPARARHDKKKP